MTTFPCISILGVLHHKHVLLNTLVPQGCPRFFTGVESLASLGDASDIRPEPYFNRCYTGQREAPVALLQQLELPLQSGGRQNLCQRLQLRYQRHHSLPKSNRLQPYKHAL